MKQGVAHSPRTRGLAAPCTACPYCAGHGRMPLPPHLLATWLVLGTDKAQGQIAAEVAERMNVTPSAAATRLNQLCGLGLAVIVKRRPGTTGRSKPAAEWIRRDG